MSIGDPASSEIVGRELHGHAVPGKHTNVVRPHLSGEVTEHLVAVLELDVEHGVWQSIDHAAVNRDRVRILTSRSLLDWCSRGWRRTSWSSINRLLWQKRFLPGLNQTHRTRASRALACTPRIPSIRATSSNGLSRRRYAIESRISAGSIATGRTPCTGLPR